MSRRVRTATVFFLFSIAFVAAVFAAKKKDQVPAYVLKARTAIVLIDPDAGVNAEAPMANKKAQEDVELALSKWGRFRLVLDTASADLVIVIRKGNGKVAQPTIGGMPTNDRPVIVQQTDSSIRIGGQQGRAPGSPQQPSPQDTRPAPGVEMSTPDDSFSVYQGNGEHSFEGLPILWRYANRNALRSPEVPAVSEFRKAIEESEKQQQKSKP